MFGGGGGGGGDKNSRSVRRRLPYTDDYVIVVWCWCVVLGVCVVTRDTGL